ncbi:dihydropteroate synthase [Litoribacter alkaliphilus]|uniref:dihydropteroate synthase n=1 Tax=Litoribacter ruber TaxID=702568 RepID=A0AAP2CFE0_9BACT|nr:dihydropteroate synthase [Litoribacter alkaliphilus]MBS9522700.1 dihydropteroate synthase [Litoribacter alkaliphilus]
MVDNFNSSGIEDNLFPPKKITLNINGRLWTLDTPWVMGILNVTPDSFFSESRSVDSLESAVKKLITEGADIIDIGGYSTRPGAAEVCEAEETERVLKGVQEVKKQNQDILISVDTFRSEVARKAVESGADMVNDISGGDLDPNMLKVVGKLKTPFICMHMRGTPQDMASKTDYQDLEREIFARFQQKLNQCRQAGINDVVLDPGFGFAKTLEQNFQLLRNLGYFKFLNTPILVGISRKSMIYKLLKTSPEDALNGTTALNMAALINGADILRVHDVKEAKETIQLYKQLYP